MVNVDAQKLIIRPFEKNLSAEEAFKKALQAAQQENDLKAIAELKANYNNTPPPVIWHESKRNCFDIRLNFLFIIKDIAWTSHESLERSPILVL